MTRRRRTATRRAVVPLIECAVSFVVGRDMGDAVRLARRRWPHVRLGDDVARCAGYAFALPDDAPEIVVLLPAGATIGTLAHECTHAAAFALNRACIRITAQDHETLAHAVGHLVDDAAPWLAQASASLRAADS